MKVLIAIASKSRPYNFKTWEWLKQCSLPDGVHIKVFVEPCEYIYYSQVVSQFHLEQIGKDNHGLGYVKTYIGEYAASYGYDLIFNLDDDISGFIDERAKIKHRVEVFEALMHEVPVDFSMQKELGIVRFLSGKSFYYVKKHKISYVYKNQGPWGTMIYRTQLNHLKPEYYTHDDMIIHLQAWAFGYYTLTYGLAGVSVDVYTNNGGMQSRNRRDDTEATVIALKEKYPEVKFVEAKNTLGYDIDASAYSPKMQNLMPN